MRWRWYNHHCLAVKTRRKEGFSEEVPWGGIQQAGVWKEVDASESWVSLPWIVYSYVLFTDCVCELCLVCHRSQSTLRNRTSPCRRWPLWEQNRSPACPSPLWWRSSSVSLRNLKSSWGSKVRKTEPSWEEGEDGLALDNGLAQDTRPLGHAVLFVIIRVRKSLLHRLSAALVCHSSVLVLSLYLNIFPEFLHCFIWFSPSDSYFSPCTDFTAF